jgi:hypothetical protein
VPALEKVIWATVCRAFRATETVVRLSIDNPPAMLAETKE